MTDEQAREAIANHDDVYTPAGDAGVIDQLRTFTAPGHRLYGRGRCALVVGAHGRDWYPLADLTPSRQLLTRCPQ